MRGILELYLLMVGLCIFFFLILMIAVTRAKLSLNNVPDERTVIGYLTFLAHNLIMVASQARVYFLCQ
jgi:hypothetical protein